MTRLPVFELLAAGHRALFRDARAAAWLAVFPVLAAAVAQTLIALRYGADIQGVAAAFRDANVAAQSGIDTEQELAAVMEAVAVHQDGVRMAFFLTVLAAVACSVPLLVGWHRVMSSRRAAAARTGIGRTEADYAIRVVGILAAVVLVEFTAGAVLGLVAGAIGVGFALAAVLFLLFLCIGIGLRLGLCLPAAALGAPGAGLADGWRLGAGNLMPLAAVGLLWLFELQILFFMFIQVAAAVSQGFENRILSHLFVSSFMYVVVFAAFVVLAGILTEARRRLDPGFPGNAPRSVAADGDDD